MAPLINWLQQHNHTQAILIPTGLLGLLPLHAAWTEDPSRPTGRRYALDEIHFTYAPNAQSLVAARAIAQQFPDSHLDSILAIENPTGDIENAEKPTKAALESFPRHHQKHLANKDATIQAVKEVIGQGYAVVNFYCHGTSNFNEPLNSGLSMSDDLLTLRELFDLKLTEGNKPGIRLAVLSACETGLPGIELADEVIGLPVGLMQAGVAGVVASLWSVSDLSTSLLLRKFYQLWREQDHKPSDALRHAQIWLRDSTNGEINAEFDDYQDYLDDDQNDYAHPFHWSAFSYLGI
jgi:CHAT domain-containing protein